ncbi:AMP-binding enzyme [Yinghuangia aomiensis]
MIGTPDEKWGELVTALVVTDGSGVTAEELIAHCRTRLAGYKCPKRVDFAESLPRTATGKLQKFKLREPYWAGHDSAGALSRTEHARRRRPPPAGPPTRGLVRRSTRVSAAGSHPAEVA